MCNGEKDCTDGSDENGAFCKGFSVAVNSIFICLQFKHQYMNFHRSVSVTLVHK